MAVLHINIDVRHRFFFLFGRTRPTYFLQMSHLLVSGALCISIRVIRIVIGTVTSILEIRAVTVTIRMLGR